MISITLITIRLLLKFWLSYHFLRKKTIYLTKPISGSWNNTLQAILLKNWNDLEGV
jgi:hypothetical protein